MDHVLKNFSFIKLLLHAHSKQRKAILESASLKQINILNEILLNIIQGIIPSTPEDQAFLQRYQRVINLLLNKRIGLKIKKRTLFLKPKLLNKFLTIAVPVLDNVQNPTQVHTNTTRKVSSSTTGKERVE